ncbi:MAG: hypothetical protein WBQ24_17110 [Xanthobacteraceae bacterium]
MVPRNEIEDEADQVLLAQQLTREIIGRELRELYEISEELRDYMKELIARLNNRPSSRE